MMAFIAIFLSALLYRMPRGGGLGPGHSFVGALIWATGSAVLIAIALHSWLPLLSLIPLMLGEAPGWSRWWPNSAEASIWRLSLRGCLLLNPLMGPIYFTAYGHRNKLPVAGRFLDGWTAWSELACGMVTASAYVIVLSFMTGLDWG